MRILLLLVLFLWYEQAFSVEMECGKTQFHMDNDLVYDCFADYLTSVALAMKTCEILSSLPKQVFSRKSKWRKK